MLGTNKDTFYQKSSQNWDRCTDRSWPVVVEVRQLVGQPLQMLRLQARRVLCKIVVAST